MRKNNLNFDEVVSDAHRDDFRTMERPLNSIIFYAVFSFAVLLGLIGSSQIFALGAVKHDFYTKRAIANINKVVPIIAPRGLITDRYDKPLVENKLIFSAFLNISEMVKANEEESALSAAEEVLNINRKDLKKEINKADLEDQNEVRLVEDLSTEQTIKLEALNLSSVSIQKDYKREYGSDTFSHVVGYVGLPTKKDLTSNNQIFLADSIGKSGLEAYYDDLLRGENGEEIIYRTASENLDDTETIIEPKIGETLKTTIDADFQEYFYDRMRGHMAINNQKKGAAIALNPKTGEIKALLSFPSFDANNIVKALTDSREPLFNRAISGVYSPGSTIKPIHAVAALKEGVVDTKTSIFSRGFIEVPNPYNPDEPSRFVDWKPQGWVDLYSALARSSNIFFYAVGGGLPANEAGIVNPQKPVTGLGIDRLNQYWRRFGFGSKTNIDIGGEANSFLPNPTEKQKRTKEPWRVGDTYNVSIGQGDVAVTPIQLIEAITAIANGGKAMKPHLDLGAEPQMLFDVSDLSPQLHEVRLGMEDVVQKPYGTTHSLADLPIRVAAKTGTAQINLNTKTNALFVGYGPIKESGDTVDNTNGNALAIIILIEEAKDGSLNTIPIANDVFEWYYDNRIVVGH